MTGRRRGRVAYLGFRPATYFRASLLTSALAAGYLTFLLRPSVLPPSPGRLWLMSFPGVIAVGGVMIALSDACHLCDIYGIAYTLRRHLPYVERLWRWIMIQDGVWWMFLHYHSPWLGLTAVLPPLLSWAYMMQGQRYSAQWGV